MRSRWWYRVEQQFGSSYKGKHSVSLVSNSTPISLPKKNDNIISQKDIQGFL